MNTQLQNQSVLRFTISAVCLATLAACGGGGGVDVDPAGVVDTVNDAQTSNPRATQPPATPSPAAPPTPAPTPTTPAPTTPTTPTSTNPTPGGSGPADNCGIPNFQVEMLRAINQARATARSCGGAAAPATAAIAWNDLLFKASAGHSKDMADRNFFSHNSPEGVNAFQRMAKTGYKLGYSGETIGYGYNGIASVMQGWLNSPDHCSIIMSGDYKDVGAACVKNTKGTPYWTLDIASPQ
jgi:uncharacterized protein YkwD